VTVICPPVFFAFYLLNTSAWPAIWTIDTNCWIKTFSATCVIKPKASWLDDLGSLIWFYFISPASGSISFIYSVCNKCSRSTHYGSGTVVGIWDKFVNKTDKNACPHEVGSSTPWLCITYFIVTLTETQPCPSFLHSLGEVSHKPRGGSLYWRPGGADIAGRPCWPCTPSVADTLSTILAALSLCSLNSLNPFSFPHFKALFFFQGQFWNLVSSLR
jgi:hypothetical protein